MVSAMRPYADSLRFDGMGSILATQGSSGPKVMVDAHMDELGGVIRRVMRIPMKEIAHSELKTIKRGRGATLVRALCAR